MRTPWNQRNFSHPPLSDLGKIESHVDPSVETLSHFQSALMPAVYETAFKSPLYLSEDASLRRLSRICAGVQAAKPKTNAGLSFA
jgi:hypothetical protein